ncbi:MAG TPA: chromate efflux transporter [Casimicrobiaceae bacterium]|nr:chromate efflux transporter [Casimicrobiaceae bacterium]
MNDAHDAISKHANAEAAPPLPTRAEAFRYWLRLGFISFGGPAGQIAIMHRELVDEKSWISERRFLHALNFCMLLPGPEATQLATYIGWLLYRTWGGLVAGVLFVLPSLAILIALSWLYVTYGNLPIVAGVLYGIKPAVVAIVLHAAWRIGSRALKHPLLWLVAAAAFVAIFVFAVPFPLIVVTAGVLGAIGGRWMPSAFTPANHDMKQQRAHPSALIDDDTPTPAHARYARSRLLQIIGVFVLLWGAILLTLTVQSGWNGALTQMAWFFTKAALVTFGGAYAVLPYVYQGAVETYGWLAPSQMIDGLALGETTPGPLIMIVAFVGFVGAWTHALFGADLRFAAGAAGGCVATFFTFLPSYLFILAGAPLIESTHGQLRFTAPLTAITAAVVGVIVNLALFFAWHVLWPRGWQAGSTLGNMEVPALVIGMAAAVALFRLKVGVIPVIAGCGIAGLIVVQTLNA